MEIGVYALVHEDNPMNDRRSAIWSYMPVFSEENNRCLPVARNISFGRIWRCESEKEGLEGIGGPYRLSFTPMGKTTSLPHIKWKEPFTGPPDAEIKEKRKVWAVGLAESETLEGQYG